MTPADDPRSRGRGRGDRDARPGSGRPADGRPSGDRGGPAGGSHRGGVGREPEQRGGSRLAPREPRRPEPAIPEGITGKELDRSVWTQLRTLTKENAEGVAQHLVMVALLLDEDIDGAQAHAETAVRRAGRVPAAREALGLVAYRQGNWAKALAEFRTVRRLSGSSHLLPLMVDAERGLGRLEKALDLASSPEAKTLARDERVELAIVVSGIRRDLRQFDVAAAGLRIPELSGSAHKPWSARLSYAYAEALLALGDVPGAREWFAHAVDTDDALETDASERLDELDGVVRTDLLGSDGSVEGSMTPRPGGGDEAHEAGADATVGKDRFDHRHDG